MCASVCPSAHMPTVQGVHVVEVVCWVGIRLAEQRVLLCRFCFVRVLIELAVDAIYNVMTVD